MTASGLSTCHVCGQPVELVPPARGHHDYRAYDPGFGELHAFTCPKFLSAELLNESRWLAQKAAQEGAQHAGLTEPRQGLFAHIEPLDEPPEPATVAKRQPARRFVGIDVPK